MKEKRKQFNAAEFISNEETPVETRDGNKVTIYSVNRDSEYKVCGDVSFDTGSEIYTWTSDGRYETCTPAGHDLFFSKKMTTRRMTNQELAWWLRDYPEEHRELTGGRYVHSFWTYEEKDTDKECVEEVLIRSNGGEWRKPYSQD